MSRSAARANFRRNEDAVDAAVPVDAQNAPTRTWKTAQTAVFHSVHTDQFFLKKKGNDEERCKCADLIVSTEGFTPMGCAQNCAHPLIFCFTAKQTRDDREWRMLAAWVRGERKGRDCS